MAKLLTEFIGAAFLVLVILLTGDPLAIGTVLMVMVYMGGHISGAHYNPAVTLGFAIRGRLSWPEAAKYWVAQLAGAIFAALTAWCLLEKTGTVAPPAGAGAHQTYLVEILFTFALCLVVFNVADTEATKGNSFYGLAIGFTITAAAFSGGGISGGAFNPAVGLGPNIVALMNSTEVPGSVWLLYILGPSIGAILATVVYKLQHSGSAS